MKQLSITLLALMAFWLAGCTVEEIENDNPKPEGTKSGLTLSAQIKQRTAGTKAIGDPFTAGKEEKRIDRIAFFVHTEEDGFQVYPPVPDADALGDRDAMRKKYPNNVYLSGTADAGYQAEVSLTAGGGYNAEIIAVANLPANYDYRQILTWEGLQDSVTVWNTTMPACLPGSEAALETRNALAMYGYCTKELAKEETNPISFDMERLVARIDITNEAYVSGATPDNHGADALGQSGFLLTSVKLLRAKPAAYLVPKPETPDVETTSDWLPLQTPGTDILYGKATAADETANPTREPDKVTVANAADAQNATLQYAWHTLYTYPNDDAEHAPTALEIKGWFRGTEITRQIPFVDKDKKAFPILGNHRYLVRIAKAPEQTDLNYSITVSEWDAVDTVNVKPDQSEVPKITNIETNGEYNKDKKFIDLYYTQDGTISFDASCSFAPDIRVKYDEPGQSNWITIAEKSEPELIVGTPNVYKRHFKVTFPGMTQKGMRHAMLLVHNGGSEVECDTVFVRHTIYYPGTDLEGVLYKGQLWAPVNCGATEVPTKVEDYPSPWKVETCGYYYQWGRKTPFSFRYEFPPDDLAPDNTCPTYEEGTAPGYEYADRFIKANSAHDNSWFSDNKNPGLSPALKDKVWPRDQQPCPAGWRIPTGDELKPIAIEINAGNKMDNTNKIWKASENNNFVLPAAGARDSNLGSPVGLCINGWYWSSTLTEAGLSSYMSFYSSGASAGATILAYGISVRCVQE